MKDKENNKTKQTSNKAIKALSDRDLDSVSGGQMIKIESDNIPVPTYIIHCNHCDYELGRYPSNGGCSVKDGSICPSCLQTITLSKCRIEVN